MLKSFVVDATFYSTICTLQVDLVRREAFYTVTHEGIIVQHGSIERLVPGTTANEIRTPDLAIDFLRKRIEGMHFSCRLIAGIEARVNES